MGFEDWSDDYAVIDRDSYDKNVMTAGELLNKLQNIPDNRFFACLAFATYAHTPDYVKEIQPDGTVVVDMAWFPYNGEEGAPCRLDLQSVKVDKSKKVIKEHRAHRPSRRRVIKESVSIQEKMDAIRVAADIIKRAMAVNKDEVLEKLEEDVNYDSSCCAFEDYDGEGITREMWENSIKYGWMAETLPYFNDWHDDLFKDIEITPEERAILEKGDNNAYVFSDEFEKGNLEGLDFCKEICSQFDVTIYPEELMIRFAGEDDDMDYESVKKPVSRRRVIKEHRVHKPSRRRLIKEERMSKERREELYKLALDLFENYEWSSDEAQEAFQEDYPSFRRDFIDDYSNSSVSDEEFTKDFTGTMAYYNSDQYLEESKKADRRRQVIKESARRHARRHLIKEWSYDDFVKVNKDRMKKILDRILSQYRDLYKEELMKRVENDMKKSFHHDDPANPDETAAYVLEKYEYIFRQSDKLYNLLTDEEKVNFEKYCDRFLEGQEGYVYDMYGGGSGFYEEVCEMDPVYKEIVDEIVQRNGGPVNWAE